MKKLITALSILIFLGFIVGGYLLGKHTSSILDFGEGLFVWLTILCASIWFGRRNKDGIYRLLKDTHQSNLDDIEQQQLEEQIDQAIVKEQFKTSLETVALVSLILYLLICSVLFIFVSDLGLVNWLILLSVIPIILIYGFLKDKITLTLKNMPKNNN
ncbi:hypothetical protein N9746_06450 [Candidatus Thioglobus sp.]|nr:hypothetical protein [Candidatus Thioglobus sp.]